MSVPYVDANQLYSTKGLSKDQIEVRQLAVNRLEAFIRLVAPYQMLSHCHIDLCRWIEDNYAENKLLLWPRDHGKSRYAAFTAAWEVVRNPAITELYASATAEKAEEQLRFIQAILDSPIMRKYFPELILPDEGKRAAWNKTYIIVDHPLRKKEGVVDATIMTAGMGKTITGKHFDRMILDDMVVPENNTEVGRRDTNAWVAQAASIMSADSSMLAVGTRYDPNDAYQMMMDLTTDDEVETEEGDITTEAKPLFQVNRADVEVDGDFLFPRQQRDDGKWFGFNERILARKKAIYTGSGNLVQFYAQYYNNPNDSSIAPISANLFRYYERTEQEYIAGLWTVTGRIVYVYAAVDLAASSGSGDYSTITVGGIDEDGNRYFMYGQRVQSVKISDVDKMIEEAFRRYQFKALRIEAVSGFKMVAEDLADRLIRKGIRIPIDYYVPPRTGEGKAARINNILEPLYQAGAVYHYRGGVCQLLEDELVKINPVNDDLKDAWAMCNDIMKPPIMRQRKKTTNVVQYHPRFGGVCL